MLVCVLAGLCVLIALVAWRPHGWGPTAGAVAGVAIAALGGAVHAADLAHAADVQWRAYVTLASVMVMTSSAERLGVMDRLAALIEPRTRGPARQAFRVTYVLSALVAAVLSNDAAILLVTPTVLVLLRSVYPRRNPKFLVPFAFAVFASAGVAPLVVSNPMNLIFAEHVGLDFNTYAVTMLPIAIAGWITGYFVLAWIFRDALADTAPALGAWPAPRPLSRAARAVLVVTAIALCAYPAAACFDVPVWPVALAAACLCALIALAAREPVRSLVHGVTWTVFPFLLGVFVLALALQRAGIVEWLASLFAHRHPLAVIGTTSAIGSAVLNNHPMSVLDAFALDRLRDAHHARAFAALVGGDLGPRLLPLGSLAALLWFDLLRRHGVSISVARFVRVGVWLTLPTLTVSLATLWLLMH